MAGVNIMIHILLILLKIIGIVLAALFTLIIVFGLLVLFWPVKYRIFGKLQKEFVIHIDFSFMKPLLMVCFDYNKEMNFFIKIMGINVLRREQNDINGDLDEEQDKEEDVKENEKQVVDDKESSELIEGTVEKPIEAPSEEIQKKKQQKKHTSYQQQRNRDKSSKGFIEKITDKLKAFKDFFKTLFHSLMSLPEIPLKIKRFISDDRIVTGCKALKNEVLYLIKQSKPKKYQWYIHFGTGDPCLTGQLLGVLGICYAAWGKGLIVEPDFEQNIFESKFDCKGNMRGIYALKFILRLYRNKDINYVDVPK